MNGHVTIKKHPIVIIKSFITFELIALALFYVAAALAYYKEIYNNLALNHFVPFEVAEFLGIIAAETLLIIFIFLRWSSESYLIRREEIIHRWGAFWKKRLVRKIIPPFSVSYRQGPVSAFFKYGHIVIVQNGGKPVVLDHVPGPKKYADLISKLGEKGHPAGAESKDEEEDITGMLGQGEHGLQEFKTSFRWDVNGGRVNKDLEKSVVKTIAAFLNSEGGRLLIGAGDGGEVLGLDGDYRSLRKQNADGFENHFSNLFNTMIGAEFRRFARLKFHKIGGKEICLIKVLSSPKPVYVRSEEGENFYVRTGNSTTPLKISEASAYIRSKWGDGA